MLRTLVVLGLIVVGCGVSRPAAAQTPTGDQLPGTQPLVMPEPLDVVMVRGINRFAERELAASRERRSAKWQRDYSSEAAYLKSIEPHRQRLREMIGAVDVETPLNPAIVIPPDDQWPLEMQRLQWSVAEGLTWEGIHLEPGTIDANGLIRPLDSRATVILIPDATQKPGELCAYGDQTSPVGLGRVLAQQGCDVLIIAPITRSDEYSGHPEIRFTNVPHRELVYRCGFELGRHPIGYEVAAVRQALRLGETIGDVGVPKAVVGIGDGGLVAMYAAAVSPEFDAVMVAGYFDERESIWRQPIDRNVFGLLTEFGDADIASLIAPRPLIIDASPPPIWNGPIPRDGRLPYAAPGTIAIPSESSVRAEYDRAAAHYAKLGQENRIQLLTGDSDGASYFSEAALRFFLQSLGIREFNPTGAPPVRDDVNLLDRYDAARQKRLVESLVRHTQMLLHRSDKQRDKFWKDADRSSPEKWAETSQKYRDYVHDHMIGRLPLPTAPLNPRSRKVIDEPTHTGWEVVLDVYGSRDEGLGSGETAPDANSLDPRPLTLDDTVIAGGILLLPKDLQPGEKRPVVVCQHGLEGVPMDTITLDESTNAWRAYKGFSTQLVKRGFIVYAPQNPYKGEDEFRVIQRKSNPLGWTLFSYIIEQHRQTLTWLATLPYVDPERIAFYGLSYGGKTAVRVPPLLRRGSRDEGLGKDSRSASLDPRPSTLDPRPSTLDHPEYCLSICSADFNEWIRKNCSAEDRYSYVYTKEYEMFEWNMGHVAGYAELSSLMAPRPFMVERGHDDGVAPDEWVGWEYAKVRRHYDKLGLGDKTEIEWFNGPHTINGQGTFEFLHRHLNWPQSDRK